jgi:hypothetical protein
MARSIWAFIKRVVRSHLGHLLLAVSWTFVLLVFAHPHLYQPQFVNCVPTGDEAYFQVIVDKVYPIWTAAIVVAHLPAIGLTVGATKLLQRILPLSCGPTAKGEVLLLFAFSAIQWLLLGYTIESLFRRWRART